DLVGGWLADRRSSTRIGMEVATSFGVRWLDTVFPPLFACRLTSLLDDGTGDRESSAETGLPRLAKPLDSAWDRPSYCGPSDGTVRNRTTHVLS
ncbi:MAG: hypothetical protein KDA60_06290, partial [Planctomycetales bacterium]|nr:hypothetical protein [Planctomycetales bacterium]